MADNNTRPRLTSAENRKAVLYDKWFSSGRDNAGKQWDSGAMTRESFLWQSKIKYPKRIFTVNLFPDRPSYLCGTLLWFQYYLYHLWAQIPLMGDRITHPLARKWGIFKKKRHQVFTHCQLRCDTKHAKDEATLTHGQNSASVIRRVLENKQSARRLFVSMSVCTYAKTAPRTTILNSIQLNNNNNNHWHNSPLWAKAFLRSFCHPSLLLAVLLQCLSPNFLVSPVTPSSHLSLGLPLCLLPSTTASKTLLAGFCSSSRITCPA